MIELIIKYCNNLRHIQFTSDVLIGIEVQKKFFDNFGHKLISLDIWFPNLYFTSAPNIEELTVSPFDSQLSQIKFNRLKKFKVSYLKAKDLNSFELFIENISKTLKHLDIVYLQDDKQSVTKLLQIISKSINLIHLGIENFFTITDNSLIYYWNEIAINCKQLKSFKCRLNYNESLRLNEELVSILKRLKRLDLEFSNVGRNYFLKLDNFRPIKDFNVLKGLTNLSIRCNKPFSETILTDIDIKLPKLKSLRIISPFTASEWTSQVLTKLTNLETIELKIKNLKIIPKIERQLILNCRKFKSLSIL